MTSTYEKPFTTFNQQVALLEQRGLVIDNRDEARRLLRMIGYYTLGGYTYSMRRIVEGEDGPSRTDEFLPGATLSQVVRIYQFDRQLRLLCLDALETIERSAKVQVAYYLGKQDPFAHATGSHHARWSVTPSETRDGAGRASHHEQWCIEHENKVGRPGNDVIREFVAKYGMPLPIWVAVDAMDFGDLSKLVGHLDRPHQIELAKRFGIRRGVEFASWIRTMCLVRNIAAHHNRLWNRELASAPTKPRGDEAEYFAGFIDSDERYWKRTYAALLVIAYIVSQVDPQTDWPKRMGSHLATLPVGCGVSYKALGAPDGWERSPAWELD